MNPPKRTFWRKWAKRLSLAGQFYSAGKAILRSAGALRDELRFLQESYEFAKEFRILIVGLGGVIDDVWNGPWGDPYALFKWALLARLARTPFVFLSVGAEQVETRLGRFFLRSALRLATYRSYRDRESKEKAEGLGVGGPNFVFPDLAFSLPVAVKNSRLQPIVADTKIAAISPMAYCDPRSWPRKDQVAYEKYLNVLTTLAEWLLSRGYHVRLFATQIRMDRAPVAELKERILKRLPTGSSERLLEAALHNVDDLLSLAGQVDFVVSSRLHGLILPCLVGTPVLAISHSSKINRLMEDMGLEAYCVDIGNADLAGMRQQILAIEAHRDGLRQQIRNKVQAYRAALEEQFKSVLGSVGSPTLICKERESAPMARL